jgi:uncharacterized delta-60 repeat protein
MTLITRQGKGSKISAQEMDSNMDYLEQNNTINIVEIASQIGPFDEDKVNYINKIEITENKTLYRGVLYGESESPISEIILKYNNSANSQLDIDLEYGDSYYFSGDLIYEGNGEHQITRLTSFLEYRPSLNGLGNAWGFSGGFNSGVHTIKIQPDGKMLAGGVFTIYGGDGHNRIIRLNFDGSVDSSFWIGDGFNNTVTTIQLQSDGKILVGGSFTQYNNITRNRIVRLNSDGSIDNTFSIGTGFNGQVTSIAIQSDGKILVSGQFGNYNNLSSTGFMVRLNTDGSVDNTFSIGTGFSAFVQTIRLQSDGKILVGGAFTSYNGTSINRIARLNSDGSIDNTFSIGTGFADNFLMTIEIQSDGKLLIGGTFTSYNGTSSNRIVRLNSDGSRDNIFNVGAGFNSTVSTIQLSSDGKVFVGGEFSEYDGVTRNKFAVLNSNGSLDNNMVINFGTSTVNVILLKSDVTLFIGTQGGVTKRIYNYNNNSYMNIPTSLGSSVNSPGTLDVSLEGKLTLLPRYSTKKFILDFNLIQIKN